ncbi:hypothetical protein NEMBOFW57_000730 [Staphylotrichum longicolle]|uniref:Uncharacterized protein n=1 Tax=Staphylotrichum longicolle TaxID=669026 RepID=A0AAD4F087_9PEZI|nr:hypothetical protein NEMBOFW57_000730 [Staphylotrichum longicolle]
MPAGGRTADADAPDTASIPPTTSLVSLFESKRGGEDMDPVKRRGPPPRESPDLVKQKPKPKPKPKLSTDLGRPNVVIGSNKSSQSVTEKGAAGEQHDDEDRWSSKASLDTTVAFAYPGPFIEHHLTSIKEA